MSLEPPMKHRLFLTFWQGIFTTFSPVFTPGERSLSHTEVLTPPENRPCPAHSCTFLIKQGITRGEHYSHRWALFLTPHRGFTGVFTINLTVIHGFSRLFLVIPDSNLVYTLGYTQGGIYTPGYTYRGGIYTRVYLPGRLHTLYIPPGRLHTLYIPTREAYTPGCT